MQVKDPLPRFPIKDSVSIQNLYVQLQQEDFKIIFFFKLASQVSYKNWR